MSKHKDPGEIHKSRCFMRAEAIRRNPEYRREWKGAFKSYQPIMQKEMEDLSGSFNDSDCELFPFEDSDLAQKLAWRWGLTVALHPDESSWDDPLDFVYPGVRAVNVFPHRECKFYDLWPNGYKVDFTPHLRNKRYLKLEIDLAKPKTKIMEEINTEIEHYLPFALSGKRQKVRGESVDNLCWQVWDMRHKEGKSPWRIAQELNPGLKTLTAKGCTREKCPEKLDFQALTNKKKETYNNKSCGKQDSCLIAEALLKNVRDAIAKAEKQIASISPIN